MCGIAGVIDLSGRPVPAESLAAARDALRHRGPDDQGLWQHRTAGFAVGLAHTRLAVLDLSAAGHQPFADPTGRWHLVYNGEVYNFTDVRRELEGRTTFHTRCDTEALLAAMMHWGVDGLSRLNGMWAFAFVDIADRRGFVARDRFGKKPLYYAACDASGAPRLAFASEVRALLPLLDGTPLVDREALHLYLSLGFIPHPLTIFQGVYKLPPGHVLEFDASGVRPPRRYYRIAAGDGASPTYTEAQERLRGHIAAAVRARRIADVPLGAFLSGGLDSSVVVSELAAAGGTVKTFSIGYADQPQYDETRYARLVADRYGTEHHEFKLTFGDVIGAVPALLDHLGEPFADSSLIPTSLVSLHTRRHVTVALSGDGGDELFGGYWRYLGHHYLARYRRMPRFVRRWLIEPLLAAAPSAKSSRWLNRVRQARKLLRADSADPFERHAAWSRIAEPETLAGLLPGGPAPPLAALLRQAAEDLAPGFASPAPSESSPCGAGCRPAAGRRQDARATTSERMLTPTEAGRDELTPLLLADVAFSLPADMLCKVDTAGMLHALEVRVPFLDPAVVEFTTSLPIEYRIDPARPGPQKHILRDAYRDRLPAEVLGHRKMGFEVPIGEFLRNELRGLYADVVRADVLADLGIDPRVADRLWHEHLRRRHERADILWAILVLCWWRRHTLRT